MQKSIYWNQYYEIILHVLYALPQLLTLRQLLIDVCDSVV